MDNNTVEIQQNNIQPQQMNYDQSQMQYQNMQPGYGQPQMQYQNVQPGYGQPQMQYQNMQPGYSQPQMQYQNMQPGYSQPMNYNQQMYPNQYQNNQGAQPGGKKLVINKKLIIVALLAVAIVLGVIFIPKLFKQKTPFDGVKFGVSLEDIQKKYDIPEDDIYSSIAFADLDGFGVTGHGQFCFYEDELQNVNWYVYKDDYSNGEYEKALKTIKEYYTDEYGEPSERDDDDYLERLRWDCGKNKRYELDVEEDMFVLRYRYSKY